MWLTTCREVVWARPPSTRQLISSLWHRLACLQDGGGGLVDVAANALPVLLPYASSANPALRYPAQRGINIFTSAAWLNGDNADLVKVVSESIAEATMPPQYRADLQGVLGGVGTETAGPQNTHRSVHSVLVCGSLRGVRGRCMAY